MSRGGTLVVAGSLAQKPRHGGHAWVFLQYLLGFRRLGWDVLFVDQLAAGATTAEATASLERLMSGFGLEGAWALLDHEGNGAAGLP
ncbi:MAG TPA: hypothetical protein VG078_07550, partial [Acidimicrobiales bacterium]|nr:hypothetical protein [Acidimicrobiales bacterium]